jgi:hypothetical protein
MLLLSVVILLQAVWIVVVLVWGWHYWKIYKNPSSVASHCRGYRTFSFWF